jgi:hypothetical protein
VSLEEEDGYGIIMRMRMGIWESEVGTMMGIGESEWHSLNRRAKLQ